MGIKEGKQESREGKLGNEGADEGEEIETERCGRWDFLCIADADWVRAASLFIWLSGLTQLV